MSAKKPAGTGKTVSRVSKVQTSARSVVSRSRVIQNRPFSLDPIYAEIRKRVPMAQQAQMRAFVATFLRRLEADEYPLHTPGEWLAIAAGMLEFVRKRKTGTIGVRVFNPDPKIDGWESPHTVLQIINDDVPFLVDSVSINLTRLGIGVHAMRHPVIRFKRDRNGRITEVGEGKPESLMLLEIDRQSVETMVVIERQIREILEDVHAAVDDWSAMREKMLMAAEDLVTRRLPIDDDKKYEVQEFLRWAAHDHFIFLGYREYSVIKQGREEILQVVEGSGLGLMRNDSTSTPRPAHLLAAHGLNRSGAGEALVLTKTSTRSRVHRQGYMDYIGVLEYDAKGRIVGERRFLGLYSSRAFNCLPSEIPLVRGRYDFVMHKSGFPPNSHSGKALRHILETLPREELLQSDEDELYRNAMGILGLRERVRSHLFLRLDRYGRFFSVLVYVPREQFNTDVRLRIESLLRESLHSEYIDSSVVLNDSPLAQVHLLVRPKADALVEVDMAVLEMRLVQALRNWQDDLREQLIIRCGESAGLKLASSYGKALPASYIEEVSPGIAAGDVEQLAALHGPQDLRLSLHWVRREGNEDSLRLKLYRQYQDIPLSDVMPPLENLGLRLIAEHSHRLLVNVTESVQLPVYIQDLEVESVNAVIDPAQSAQAFEEAFVKIWHGDAEDDGLNSLVLRAGLNWRQVAMLRGYWKYLLQIGVPFSQNYVEETLARYPLLARLLVELFEARFDPMIGREGRAEARREQDALRKQLLALAAGDASALTLLHALVDTRGSTRETRQEACRQALSKLMDSVSSLDEDRILRAFISVIEATLRTNYYQTDKTGAMAHCIGFKLDPAVVPDLPKPCPYREIFVYGPRVEGVHFRFGPVARGGLRWSDRREDFRTEVLGLVKAQMVKNSVIVPVGAKGGFFVKRPPIGGDRDALLAEGVACYRMFIQTLLDITDNIVEDRIVPPRHVVRYDGDDPYLVVAADKGTASFSDIANALSIEHGFWLGDAFASGGSAGYDHKRMGITARGAWESVKRHFRTLGHDCQSQDFTCVGIGDMSGDVFGNGMLLSRHIRLVAAFDHRHIFLDPEPDSAASFKERERLSKLARSSWADYDVKRISRGGGVYSRSLKIIEISPPVRTALGLSSEVKSLTPDALIRAILCAPVDLLWNGGIGTYVKAGCEQQADAGDRANNAVRVDGGQLRCKIVGEGGNLGFTQRGRIEAAHQGVLLNTDFIDNSAGVDTSDHEVNIKILLNDAVRAGKLKLPARKQLLASMTDEVARLVLWDNYRQNQAISLMERMSVERLGSKQHFIQVLEAQGLLDRQIEFLPSDAELSARRARGQGLTRPELAVLLSYSKLVAYQWLLDSDVPEDPYLSKEMLRYFPQPLQKKYADAMGKHRLKREIIATAVTNTTINRMGATFLLRMQEDTGRSAAEAAKAYTISREVLGAQQLWAQLDALDGKVPESVQIDALQVIWHLQRWFVRWLLGRPGKMPGITDAVERYRGPFAEIRSASGVLPDSQRPAYERRLQEWKDKGMPLALAQQMTELTYLESAFDINELALANKLKPVEVSRVYFRVGEALRTPWLFEQIGALRVDGRWHAIARGVLHDELAAHLRVLAGQALKQPGTEADVKVRHWIGRDDARLRFTLSMLEELSTQQLLDYPTLSVAVQKLGQLAAQG
ncbi:MAG: NAD-glutamate dehydrogenase [Xanthomonadaceae bacterium]|jgi:glutamate dehydrogenase|nr:NAD-glutamate dehydrogenase [Xanthomonadaceae bacterium]